MPLILFVLSFSLFAQKLDFKNLEKSFNESQNLEYKARLSYILSQAPKKETLQTSPLYYTKFADRFNKYLNQDQKCDVKIKLIEYYQDFGQNDKSLKPILDAKGLCKLSAQKLRVDLRDTWYLVNLGKFNQALGKVQSLLKSSANQQVLKIHGKTCFYQYLKKRKLCQIKSLSDTARESFIKAFELDYQKELPKKELQRLFLWNKEIANKVMSFAVIKLENYCDLHFMTSLKGLNRDNAKNAINLCLSQSSKKMRNAKTLYSVINKLENYNDADFQLLKALIYVKNKKPPLACKAYLSSGLFDNTDVILGIKDHCQSYKELAAYLPNEKLKPALIKVLAQDFSYSNLKKHLDELNQEELSFIMQDHIRKVPTSEYQKVPKALYLTFLSKKYNDLNKEIKRQIYEDLDGASQVRLIGSLKLKGVEFKEHQCPQKLSREATEQYLIGLILSQKKALALRCFGPNYPLLSQSVFKNEIDLLPETIDLKIAKKRVYEEVNGQMQIPHYKMLTPKSDFKLMRKDLFQLSKNQSIRLRLRPKTNEHVFHDLSRLRRSLNSAYRRKWYSKKVKAQTIKTIKTKIQTYKAAIERSQFNTKKILNFIQEMQNA